VNATSEALGYQGFGAASGDDMRTLDMLNALRFFLRAFPDRD